VRPSFGRHRSEPPSLAGCPADAALEVLEQLSLLGARRDRATMLADILALYTGAKMPACAPVCKLVRVWQASEQPLAGCCSGCQAAVVQQLTRRGIRGNRATAGSGAVSIGLLRSYWAGPKEGGAQGRAERGGDVREEQAPVAARGRHPVVLGVQVNRPNLPP
jgi:hypothetical protein